MNKKEYAYKAVFWSLFIGWGIIVVLIGIGLFDKKEDHIVVDRETVGRSVRGPLIVVERTDTFYVGDTLSSKENGALIVWEPWMGEELIVGVVSDSGLVIF